MTENTFWQALRSKLVPRVYAMKLNLRFIKGVPDAWLSGMENDLWLELKYVPSPGPMIVMTDLLTPLQQEWLRERHAEGRWVGVLLGTDAGHLFFPGLDWEKPISREKFMKHAKKTRDIAEDLINMLGERVLH